MATPEPTSNSPLHTIVLSDIHLTEAEPPHPRRPLWKRYKRPKLFVDRSFKNLLEYLQANITDPIELVLNGDIFDFDSMIRVPEKATFDISWLERKRGLFAEEEKSRYKLSVIMDDHKIWMETLREFILNGHKVIFIIGNHDVELQWPSVQQDFIHKLDLPEDARVRVRFCEWFYISNKDTLIEHSNQYDAYCVRSNPIHPLIRKGSRVFMRIPFGNMSTRFITNGLGLINPHADSNFIMSLREYIVFFYKYGLRTQPLLPLSFVWSAVATLFYSVTEGLLPSLKDPLTTETRVEEIAVRANASPHMVRGLRDLQVHAAVFNPIKVMRELWLDRILLLLLIFLASFQFFSFINVFIQVSYLWFLVPFFLLLPVLFFYARTVKSDIQTVLKQAVHSAPMAAQITRVQRVVHGHTHQEKHQFYQGVEIINSGTWSPAYLDVECTKPYGRKCFVWIRPKDPDGGRVAELVEWKDPGLSVIPKEKDAS